MFYREVSHVIFNLHLGVGHSVLSQMEGVGNVFSNRHIFKCSSRNQTRVTLVGSEHSHHCAMRPCSQCLDETKQK